MQVRLSIGSPPDQDKKPSGELMAVNVPPTLPSSSLSLVPRSTYARELTDTTSAISYGFAGARKDVTLGGTKTRRRP
jgi:hypothetical protein